jgi:hypothetical protein
MTGPAREDMPFSDDIDQGPPESIPPKRDAWDEEEGVPVDVEDIAIVAYEALRAYRGAMGGRPGFAWMHQNTSERKAWVGMIQTILDDAATTVTDDDTETRLVVAIVHTLKP